MFIARTGRPIRTDTLQTATLTKYLILQSQKKGGDSVNGEVIAGGDEFLLNISLINVDVSYVISATKIEPITF